MINKIKIWALMAFASTVMVSCEGEKKKVNTDSENDSAGAGMKAQESASELVSPQVFEKLTKPVKFDSAKAMAIKYQKNIDKGKKLSKYVVFDISTMEDMLKAFKLKGDHVKVYFGAQVFKGKHRMTVFFQNAKFRGSVDASGTVVANFDDVLYDATDVAGTSPYDVGFPCPPPKCPGTSQYYDSTALAEN